ncbi:uncharacterized protein LOC132607994 [Lycium barbarum]|uniref:uncharacterized protein LOC132607994 n=1 Tax=Lycium barbarum TaxID=112863 RepID=UPI00293F11B0|nr:uncharacterized protein LOC132607994 [Lycium barbarum]
MDEESTAQNFLNAAKEVIYLLGRWQRVQEKQGKGLMEPLQQAYKLDSYRRRLGLETALCNVSGKIWAFVDAEYEINVLVDSVQQMTLKLSNSNNSTKMIVTLVYAKCDRIERRELWESLYHLGSDLTLPWLVGGDFNVIIDEEEKYGGLPVTLNEVEDFRHYIQSYNLSDLGYKGSIFTWWNGRGEDNCVFKRLDRCLGNFELQQLFPGLEITHLIKFGSDHSPLLLECKQQVQQFKKSFKFLNFRTKHDTFLNVVKDNWETDDAIKAHEVIFEANPSYANRGKLMKVQFDILKHVPSMISKEQNEELVANPTKDEVKQAVFGLNSESACGPDGFTGLFFQKCWDIVGDDIFHMVWDFFREFELSRYITHINLVLLPKKQEVQAFSVMRPISLSNFINKEFSRVVHERLVHLVPDLISQNQAIFVRGKSIVENILLTQEIITVIRLRTKKRNHQIVPNVVMELDMTKTYDRLSWIF